MNLSFIYKNSIILSLLKIITLKFTMFILTILTYSLSRSSEIIFLQPTIRFIIFWDFSMFYQIFHSPQVKRLAIITCKHDI